MNAAGVLEHSAAPTRRASAAAWWEIVRSRRSAIDQMIDQMIGSVAGLTVANHRARSAAPLERMRAFWPVLNDWWGNHIPRQLGLFLNRSGTKKLPPTSGPACTTGAFSMSGWRARKPQAGQTRAAQGRKRAHGICHEVD